MGWTRRTDGWWVHGKCLRPSAAFAAAVAVAQAKMAAHRAEQVGASEGG